MKKISNIKLIGVFMALAMLYFIVDFTGSRKKSKSLRTTLVEIDTASVTKLQILMPKDTLRLSKEGDTWKLKLDSKEIIASKGSVNNALAALITIKPSRMVTKSREKWKDYQVDSIGTRVMVFEGNDKTLDIVIGRFGMQGQRQYHTFVKLFDDNEVYVAENFMSFSVPKDAASYRDQILGKIKKDSLLSITFTYPSDSSFHLSRVDDAWQINGAVADSASVTKYVNGLSYISSRVFMDEEDQLTAPLITADFIMTNDQIKIEGYLHQEQWVFHSSANESGYFLDPAVLKKVFIGASELK